MQFLQNIADEQKTIKSKIEKILEILTKFQHEGAPVAGQLPGGQEESSDLRDMRIAAKTQLLSLLRFDILDENVLEVVSLPGYKVVIGQILGQEIPASSDPNFPKVFNNAFFQLQFTDRLLAYMCWGESAR